MKIIDKIMQGMTWAAWAVFILCVVTMEEPSGLSCLGLILSATWLVTSALIKEEIGVSGDVDR